MADGGAAGPLRGSHAGDRPLGWSADGRWIYLVEMPGVPQEIVRLKFSSGGREPGRPITPADPAGFVPYWAILMTADGKYYCCTWSAG